MKSWEKCAIIIKDFLAIHYPKRELRWIYFGKREESLTLRARLGSLFLCTEINTKKN